METNDDLLNRLYYTEKNFVGANKLWRLAVRFNRNITPAQVQLWLNQQEATQLLKPEKKPKAYMSIRSGAPRSNYQADIIVYNRYKYQDYKRIMVD